MIMNLEVHPLHYITTVEEKVNASEPDHEIQETGRWADPWEAGAMPRTWCGKH